MIYAAMVFAWVGSIIYNLALVLQTTRVIDGVCYAYAIWKNEAGKIIHLIWNFVSLYVMILLIFIFCYWRILVVIRRQASVMAGHSFAVSSAAQIQSNKIKTSVIKTMVLVCALYGISWLPTYICILLLSLNSSLALPDSGYYASVFIAFLYICINPFIYAIKFDPVKEMLLLMIPCKKTAVQAAESVAGALPSTAKPA